MSYRLDCISGEGPRRGSPLNLWPQKRGPSFFSIIDGGPRLDDEDEEELLLDDPSSESIPRRRSWRLGSVDCQVV
jgi:hypothetical protein